MNSRNGLYLLTGLNVALLTILLVQQLQPAFAQGEPPVLRGRALEIVDSPGRVRASISVLPPDKSAAGADQATSSLKLRNENGRERVLDP
jgi:hypothetical protein